MPPRPATSSISGASSPIASCASDWPPSRACRASRAFDTAKKREDKAVRHRERAKAGAGRGGQGRPGHTGRVPPSGPETPPARPRPLRWRRPPCLVRRSHGCHGSEPQAAGRGWGSLCLAALAANRRPATGAASFLCSHFRALLLGLVLGWARLLLELGHSAAGWQSCDCRRGRARDKSLPQHLHHVKGSCSG